MYSFKVWSKRNYILFTRLGSYENNIKEGIKKMKEIEQKFQTCPADERYNWHFGTSVN